MSGGVLSKGSYGVELDSRDEDPGNTVGDDPNERLFLVCWMDERESEVGVRAVVGGGEGKVWPFVRLRDSENLYGHFDIVPSSVEG
jgi:hypothetical protein